MLSFSLITLLQIRYFCDLKAYIRYSRLEIVSSIFFARLLIQAQFRSASLAIFSYVDISSGLDFPKWNPGPRQSNQSLTKKKQEKEKPTTIIVTYIYLVM